eukprot:NP_497555.1 Uncharacterized protein CELE_W04B5.6 [Caenorhabditis elegans]
MTTVVQKVCYISTNVSLAIICTALFMFSMHFYSRSENKSGQLKDASICMFASTILIVFERVLFWSRENNNEKFGELAYCIFVFVRISIYLVTIFSEVVFLKMGSDDAPISFLCFTSVLFVYACIYVKYCKTKNFWPNLFQIFLELFTLSSGCRSCQVLKTSTLGKGLPCGRDVEGVWKG